MQTVKSQRKTRSDAGKIVWTDRDVLALTWIGQQYAIRLDQLQWLLGQHPGCGAVHPDWISEGSARDVVSRWKRAGWVRTEQIRAKEPFWVWPTRQALATLGLPYQYRDIGQSCLAELKHLYAINEIRLHECDEEAVWVSERQLLHEVIHISGQELLHRPDGEMYWADGGITAIEAELSLKRPEDLAENLMELVRGEGYLRLKSEHGVTKARSSSHGERSKYSEIWYFGPAKVRRQVRRERARLRTLGTLSEEEAKRIFVKWYPLVKTEEEETQQNEEDDEALDLGGQEDEADQ
jgi:hypothetical protein